MDVIPGLSKSVKMKEEMSLVEDDNSGESEEKNITEETQNIQYTMIQGDDRYRMVQFADVEEVPSSMSNSIYTDPLNGRIFVIGTSPDIYPVGQKNITTRPIEETRPSVTRDDKRRATHNEVERRRRDKINHWIMKLGKIIPDCKQDSSRGSFESQSKGGILAKACDYITDLRETNDRLLVFAKENEQLLSDIETLSQQNEQLKDENARLKTLLRQAGISQSEIDSVP